MHNSRNFEMDERNIVYNFELLARPHKLVARIAFFIPASRFFMIAAAAKIGYKAVPN